MRVDDLLGGADFRELPVVGSPAHPLRLRNVVADAAVRSKLAPQLEGAPQRPVMSRFALALVGEPIRLGRREGEGAVGQVEFVLPAFPSAGRRTTTVGRQRVEA